MMDTLGIQAQILYPNVAGFGNQNFMKVDDAALRIACVEIYNDAMAELQAASGEPPPADDPRAVVGHRRLRGRDRALRRTWA